MEDMLQVMLQNDYVNQTEMMGVEVALPRPCLFFPLLHSSCVAVRNTTHILEPSDTKFRFQYKM